MEHFPGHKCQLTLGSRSYIPKLLPTAPMWRKLLRRFQKCLIVSNTNPLTSRYFKSQGAIGRERRRQAKLPYTVIHPCSSFLAIWRIISLFAFIIFIIIKPAYISFYEKLADPGPIAQFINISVTSILYIEIVVKLFSGYYDEANEMFILCRTNIQQQYLRSTLFPDIISSFPGIIILRLNTHREPQSTGVLICLYMAFLAFLLCFLNIPKYKQYYEIISAYYDFHARTDLMIKLAISSVYMVHLVALLKEIVPAIGVFLENNAIPFSYALISNVTLVDVGHSTPQPNNLVFTYARSFLFSLDDFIGCGFINLELNRNIYREYVDTFTMLCGWILRAFFIIILKNTIMSHDRSSALYDSLMRDVKEYCTKYKLRDDLAANIQTYLEYKFPNKYFDEVYIFRTLGHRLKTQVTIDQCKKLVEQVDIFQNLPRSLMKNIINCLILEIYLPGEYLLKAGEVGTKMYFLLIGSTVVESEAGKKFTSFEDGSYFGEISLLMHDVCDVSVIAVEICEVFTLTKTDFYNVIESNEELLAQMQQIVLQRFQDSNRQG